MAWEAIAGALAGAYMDRQEARHNAKQQYVYNSWLQDSNQEFQREMAQNAHQYEVEDLKKAGLNPILSAMGSSAGSIAGSSAPQGTTAGNISTAGSKALENALATIQTNSTKELNEKLAEKAGQETLESAERTKNITPQARAKIKNLNSATLVNEAEKELKESETDLNRGGIGAKILGSDKNLGDLAEMASYLIGGGGIAFKGYKILKKMHSAKHAGDFIKNYAKLN